MRALRLAGTPFGRRLLATTTVNGSDCVWLPATSWIRRRSVWDPFEICVVSTAKVGFTARGHGTARTYGGRQELSAGSTARHPCSSPSIASPMDCTPPPRSAAAKVKNCAPLTVSALKRGPPSGAVNDGGSRSSRPMRLLQIATVPFHGEPTAGQYWPARGWHSSVAESPMAPPRASRSSVLLGDAGFSRSPTDVHGSNQVMHFSMFVRAGGQALSVNSR